MYAWENNPAGICEDAPCCGCCGPQGDGRISDEPPEQDEYESYYDYEPVPDEPVVTKVPPMKGEDFRYEFWANPEPDQPSDLYTVMVIETKDGVDTGKVLERYGTDNPWSAIGAAREARMYTLEERWAMDAEREARERRGW